MKSPPAESPAGFVVSDLFGRLVQAIAVRRHGGAMVMVVTVMAAALHLIRSYGQGPECVNLQLSPADPSLSISNFVHLCGELGFALMLQQLDDALVKPI